MIVGFGCWLLCWFWGCGWLLLSWFWDCSGLGRGVFCGCFGCDLLLFVVGLLFLCFAVCCVVTGLGVCLFGVLVFYTYG